MTHRTHRQTGISTPNGRSASGRPDAASIAMPNLNKGQRIYLVRWNYIAHGWTSELISGAYCTHTPDTWRVLVDGEVVDYSRDTWSLCSP
ncbi:hypothetical protein ABMA10_00235 [Plantibacter sp. RU18]